MVFKEFTKMAESPKKTSLKKLAESLPAHREDHRILKQTARDLIGEVKALVRLDAPLPTAELSRYLTMVCMSGIHDSNGTEQRDWVRIMTGVLRTEVAARKLDSDEDDAIERRIEQVEKISKAADKYKRFTDVEYESEDAGNGATRPKEGKKGKVREGA